MRLDLRIGTVVVDGVPADGHGLGPAVESELRRLALARGVPERLRQGGATPQLDAGTVEAGRGPLGPAVARAVWEALEG